MGLRGLGFGLVLLLNVARNRNRTNEYSSFRVRVRVRFRQLLLRVRACWSRMPQQGARPLHGTAAGPSVLLKASTIQRLKEQRMGGLRT